MSTFRSITAWQGALAAATVVWERFGATTMRRVIAFLARRAERRLLRELATLDTRLLDDIGTDRVARAAGRQGFARQAREHAVRST